MDELKNIIAQQRAELDSELPLEGDFERFMAKWEEAESDSRKPNVVWGRSRAFVSVAASVAVVLALGFSIDYFSPQKQIVRTYTHYCNEVAAISAQMQIMVTYDKMEELNSIIENIDYESVPLMSILPDEMSDREKLKVVREHYRQKMDGLKNFKVLLTETKINEEL